MSQIFCKGRALGGEKEGEGGKRFHLRLDRNSIPNEAQQPMNGVFNIAALTGLLFMKFVLL